MLSHDFCFLYHSGIKNMLQSQQRLIYLIDINRLNFLDFPLSGGIIHQEKSKENIYACYAQRNFC
jgi:hypothetical protein